MDSPSPPIYIIDGSNLPRQFAQTSISSMTPGVDAVYIDYVNGCDTNTGTRTKPFKTSDAALAFIHTTVPKKKSPWL